MKKLIRDTFLEQYKYNPDKIYYSPGRVNIIGGHTDYNGGAVLPFCINLGIYGAISFRSDSIVNVYSKNFSEAGIISFSLDDIDQAKDLGFVNYILGTIIIYKQANYPINKGFDLAIYGNLPKGGGLSSSAALLVLVGKIFNDYFNFSISNTDIAILARKVENDYIGIKCGIMDQFVIANGLKDRALFLKTNTLEYEHIPLNLKDYKFVLVNSRTTRKLIESSYNTRQQESLEILNTLKSHLNINNICDLSPDDFYRYENLIEDFELRNRFKHLVFENHRVLLAKVAFLNNDYIKLGKLLTEAHDSASKLYKVSSNTLDILVKMGLESGSLGSKMIGGGFGGSTLNLVKNDNLDNFMNQFKSRYVKEFNMEPIINVVYPLNNTGELK